ncbi:hypothetical protein QQ054_10715 [Oscillatoria amoena NRMC-F 0135]|nr:hypothetical protein [Oscillatoria amoena NRMC-F 0135]
MITEQLKALVRQEADNLKKYATTEELSRLDFEELTPADPNFCIYGQMTGYCRGNRAMELLSLSSLPYSDRLSEYKPTTANGYIKLAPTGLNAFSPIEFYICQPGANNSKLIAYLKGETDNLEL